MCIEFVTTMINNPPQCRNFAPTGERRAIKNRESPNGYGFQPAGPVDAVCERLGSRVHRLQDSLIGIKEAPHLFPTLGLRSPQIKGNYIEKLTNTVIPAKAGI
jgi:hypothetical protein